MWLWFKNLRIRRVSWLSRWAQYNLLLLCCLVAKSCASLCDPVDCSLPSSSMGFSRQEYWSGLPFPFPGDLPDPGIEPGFPALEADSLTSEPPGKPTHLLKRLSFSHFIFLLPCQRLIDSKCVDLFWSSLFCFIDTYGCFSCQYHTLLITVVL